MGSVTNTLTWYWPTRSGLPPLVPMLWLTAVVLLLAVTAPLVEIDFIHVAASLPKLGSFLSHFLVVPDWNYLPELGLRMLETIEMAVLGTAVAIVFSVPLALLAARNTSPHVAIGWLTTYILTAIRALPELTWAVAFVAAVGLGPLAGIMALAFVTIGFMAKFFAEAIEVVDRGAVEGIRAQGAGRVQTIAFAMLPQAMPDFISALLYILDHNLRAASILGLVGAGGIGYDLVMNLRLYQYDRLMMIALAIYVVVTALDRLSTRFRHGVI